MRLAMSLLLCYVVSVTNSSLSVAEKRQLLVYNSAEPDIS